MSEGHRGTELVGQGKRRVTREFSERQEGMPQELVEENSLRSGGEQWK